MIPSGHQSCTRTQNRLWDPGLQLQMNWEMGLGSVPGQSMGPSPIWASFKRGTFPGQLENHCGGRRSQTRSWGRWLPGASCWVRASIFSAGYFRPWPCLVFPRAAPWLTTFLPWFIKNQDKSPNKSFYVFSFFDNCQSH